MKPKKTKTLKDIESVGNTLEGLREKWYSENELKQEAIKWIKEDIKLSKDEVKEMKLVADEFIERWMERFNITEEDLK